MYCIPCRASSRTPAYGASSVSSGSPCHSNTPGKEALFILYCML